MNSTLNSVNPTVIFFSDFISFVSSLRHYSSCRFESCPKIWALLALNVSSPHFQRIKLKVAQKNFSIVVRFLCDRKGVPFNLPPLHFALALSLFWLKTMRWAPASYLTLLLILRYLDCLPSHRLKHQLQGGASEKNRHSICCSVIFFFLKYHSIWVDIKWYFSRLLIG